MAVVERIPIVGRLFRPKIPTAVAKDVHDSPSRLPSTMETKQAAVVSFYASGNEPIDTIREQLAEQFKDGEVVSSIVTRIEAAREAKQKKG